MPNLLSAHKYLFLLPLAIVEGPLVAVACGVGAALNYLNPFLAYGILVVGDLLPDLMYYGLGRWGVTLPSVRRTASRTRLIRDNLLSLETLWRARPLMTLISAKLAYGASAPLIVSAGLCGVRPARFCSMSLLISALYLGFLMGVGYGFTQVYGYLNFTDQHAAFYITLAGCGFLLLLTGMLYYTRKQIDLGGALKKSSIITD